MSRSTYISDFGGSARYSNQGYDAGGFGTNGRFSIYDNYVGLEARAASNPQIADYLNNQLQPFNWDEMAWQKRIGALELDEAGKEAIEASGINPHPWPIEAEQNPFAKAGPLGSIWPNPATGSGAYQQWTAQQQQPQQPQTRTGLPQSPANIITNITPTPVANTPIISGTISNVADGIKNALSSIGNQISSVLPSGNSSPNGAASTVSSLTSNPIAILIGIGAIVYFATKK